MKNIKKVIFDTKAYKKIPLVIKGLWFYFWGNIFADFVYDRKYLTGKYFSGKFGGICARGWRWVVSDCVARFLFGVNKGVPYPISHKMCVVNAKDIYFDVDDLNNFQNSGNYYQAAEGAKIVIGKGTWIAQNVGLITANHDVHNPDEHVPGKDIIIGENSWIGMNSVILPGVVLGPHTTVGAGSIVTKSFDEGFCVIAGNPAKVKYKVNMN